MESNEISEAQEQALIYLTEQCLGISIPDDGVHAIMIYQSEFEKGSKYQIMLHPTAEEAVSDFWEWHLRVNEQWYPTPVEAAAAFVKAWLEWSNSHNIDLINRRFLVR